MKDGICYIVSAGDASKRLLPKKMSGDLVIAADAGYLLLRGAGIEPDLYVGDGDSLGFVPDVKDKLLLPSVKNDTDTVAAVDLGFERGYGHFVLFGALGGRRFSHSLANVQTLLYIDSRGGEGVIVDENCTVRLLTAESGEYALTQRGGYFSLFAVAGDVSVSVKGAKYELDHGVISPDFPLGVSNEPQDGCAVTVHSGRVILVLEP